VLPEATSRAAEVVDLGLFQQTYATNVFGPVAVLEAFLPQLRRSPQGRIVNVSSTMGSLTDQTDPRSPYYDMIVPGYHTKTINTMRLWHARAAESLDLTLFSQGNYMQAVARKNQ